MQCKLCHEFLKGSNRTILQTHLSIVHNIDEKQYIVQTEYNGIIPRCVCNLCDEIPIFERGKFKRYAFEHHRFDIREELWVKKFGNPLCQNIECKNIVEFFRGLPKKYCSRKCCGKNVGFSLEKTQHKILETVRKRYGVDNIFQAQSVKEAISEYYVNNPRGGWHHSNKTREIISLKSTERWSDLNYKKRVSNAISKSLCTPEHHEKRSQKMKLQNTDPIFLEKCWNASCYRKSKLHLKFREKLELETLGFLSEQRINRFWVDELHYEKKIIIEINGNYVHANPKFYGPDFIVKLKGQTYTAKEKWEADAKRKEILESLGYKLLTIWESDDLVSFKFKLNQLFES